MDLGPWTLDPVPWTLRPTARTVSEEVEEEGRVRVEG